jgi:hypothetical protein
MSKIKQSGFLILMICVLIFFAWSIYALPQFGSVKKSGPDYLYPNIQLTPGAINPVVDQKNISQTICKSGWTATIRPTVSYTNALKSSQMAKLSENGPSGYEEDHFISLELGGNPTSTQNLWPEAYSNPDGIGARQKDQTETYLKNQICTGKITIQEAQSDITNDWYSVYLTIKGKFGGIGSNTDD